MKESPNETDPNINAQLTKKFFINLEYIFHLDSTNKKRCHIIDHTLAKKKLTNHSSVSLTTFHLQLVF